MSSGTVASFSIVAVIIILLSAGIWLLSGTYFLREEILLASEETGSQEGPSCGVPSAFEAGEADWKNPSGLLPALDLRVRTAGKSLKMATFGLG